MILVFPRSTRADIMLLPILIVKARYEYFACFLTGRVDEFIVVDVDTNMRKRLLVGIEKH